MRFSGSVKGATVGPSAKGGGGLAWLEILAGAFNKVEIVDVGAGLDELCSREAGVEESPRRSSLLIFLDVPYR